MGGKPVIAQHFFIICTSLLMIAWLCQQLLAPPPQPLPRALRAATPAIILWVLCLLWLVIQALPLPIEWVLQLSPQRLQFYQLPDEPQTLTLSVYPWATKHDTMLSFAYLELFILTLALVNSVERLKKFTYALVIFGVLQASYGSFMVLSGMEMTLWFEKYAHRGDATGTLLNRNHLANYLAFCAAAGIGLLLAQLSSGQSQTLRQWLRQTTTWLLGTKGFIRIALVIMVISLILTHSRMGNIAFFISLTTTGVIWMLLARRINKASMILFGSLFVIDIFLMGNWFGLERVAERLESTDMSTEVRNRALPYIVEMMDDFQLAGIGAGGFSEAFPYYSELHATKHYNEAHTDYLQFIIEYGVIGFIPLLLIVLLSVFQALQSIRKRNSRFFKALGFTALMPLLATGIHASVEYTLQRPGTASLFVVFLALAWITAHLESGHGRRKK